MGPVNQDLLREGVLVAYFEELVLFDAQDLHGLIGHRVVKVRILVRLVCQKTDVPKV